MRRIEDLLEEARAAGIAMSAVGHKLRMRAEHRPPDDLLRELVERKEEVLVTLSPGRRLAYGFKLIDGGGGTLRTTAVTIQEAWNELSLAFGSSRIGGVARYGSTAFTTALST
jgi:hypothetical protein